MRISLIQVGKTMQGNGAFARSAGSGFRIEGLDLEIPDGKVVVVLGPSGCGKSTLLRLIAGLIPLDSGRILYDGVDVGDVPPGERKIGMVFQNYALYPHVDSRANVLSYFWFKKKTPELNEEAAAKYRRTAELLGVDIEKLMDRMPKGLSGGERQRVAVARCITRDPGLFLLDEPFSNLDQKLRERYRTQLRILLKQFNITTVYVTHDQVEAMILADLIALMKDGRVVQVGSAQEIYDEPRNIFAADFVNFEPETPSINFLDGARVDPELADFTLGVRPEHVALGEDGGLVLQGELLDCRRMPLRKLSVLCLRAAGGEIYARAPEGASYEIGAKLPITLRNYHLFDKPSGERVRSVRG